MIDPLVARSLAATVLQPLQRALARQRVSAVARPQPSRADQISLARRQRQQYVVAQPVVVVQILVAQRDPEHPLRHQIGGRVLHPRCIPVVHEAVREAAQPARALLHLAQQQHPTVRAHMLRFEPAHHRPASQTGKLNLRRATLCLHRSALLFARLLLQINGEQKSAGLRSFWW